MSNVVYAATTKYTVKEYNGSVSVFSEDGLERQFNADDGSQLIRELNDTKDAFSTSVDDMYDAIDEVIEEYI